MNLDMYLVRNLVPMWMPDLRYCSVGMRNCSLVMSAAGVPGALYILRQTCSESRGQVWPQVILCVNPGTARHLDRAGWPSVVRGAVHSRVCTCPSGPSTLRFSNNSRTGKAAESPP